MARLAYHKQKINDCIPYVDSFYSLTGRIETMAVDADLLKRILEHYKHRLDGFLQDENIKPVASVHFTKHIADLKAKVDGALGELGSLSGETEIKSWAKRHHDILRPAVSQYETDAKQFRDAAHSKLSRPDLRQLEIELARITAEIVTLLNL